MFYEKAVLKKLVILMLNHLVWSMQSSFNTEAVTRTYSTKKIFLKIRQNLEENNYSGVSFFNKVAG